MRADLRIALGLLALLPACGGDASPGPGAPLEVVTGAGVYVSTSCTEGTCGSCETPILEGRAEHRDVVLSPEEQEEGKTMMICVSRAACPKLVLDL